MNLEIHVGLGEASKGVSVDLLGARRTKKVDFGDALDDGDHEGTCIYLWYL